MFLLILLWTITYYHILNFNTSHVSINRLSEKWESIKEADFNTSHVSINRPIIDLSSKSSHNFNTSHVSINQRNVKWYESTMAISIHLMFLLIKENHNVGLFQYTISIHLMFLLITSKQYQAWKNR